MAAKGLPRTGWVTPGQGERGESFCGTGRPVEGSAGPRSNSAKSQRLRWWGCRGRRGRRRCGRCGVVVGVGGAEGHVGDRVVVVVRRAIDYRDGDRRVLRAINCRVVHAGGRHRLRGVPVARRERQLGRRRGHFAGVRTGNRDDHVR